MVRTPCYNKNGMKKGAWSREEDERLRRYIERYGHWNWRELPRFAGLSRCGKSCRLRWMNYLKPNVIRGNYTEEEDEIIIKLHKELGTKWSVIASRLPGRTDNDIKNHWHTTLKKRVKEPLRSAEKEKTTDLFAKEENLDISTLSQETSSIISIADFSESSASNSVLDYPFATFNEDFWTIPFVIDNTYFQHQYTPIWAEGEFFNSPFDKLYEDNVIFLDEFV